MHYSLETYRKNARLILLFSLSFLIAFAIPILAAFPTFNDAGAILIRTSSLFYFNLTPLSASVIIIASIFSLLFLSFAIVSINVIVKHSRMHVRVSAEVLKGIEKYTGRIFAVLGLFTLAIFASEVLTYGIKPVGLITAIVGLALTPFVFYAPASIVMEDSRIGRAMKRSAKFFCLRLRLFPHMACDGHSCNHPDKSPLHNGCAVVLRIPLHHSELHPGDAIPDSVPERGVPEEIPDDEAVRRWRSHMYK